MTPKKQAPTILIVAGGLTRLHNRKLAREWFVLPKGYSEKEALAPPGTPPSEDVRLYSGRKMVNHSPGTIRRVRTHPKDKDSIYVPGEYVGMWEDMEWRTQVGLEDRVITHVFADEKREKKEQKEDPLLQILEPLQTIYNRMGPPGRAQLIARVVYELQKGRRL